MPLSGARNVPFFCPSFGAATLSDASNVPADKNSSTLILVLAQAGGLLAEEDLRNTQVKQRHEKNRAGEKFMCASQVVSLFLTVLQHQAMGVRRAEPCLNPTDRSSRLTADGNQ